MKTNVMTEELYRYVAEHCPLPHPVLTDVMRETAKLQGANMQISPDQGSFMHLAAKLIGAKRTIEVGCFTGFSAIAVASALPKDGKLITLDINPETAKMANNFFTKAGLQDVIELRLGPALESLKNLENEFGAESFDLAFIDADKANIPHYYEHCLELLRSGGLIMVDNVLWGGSVINPNRDADTLAIHQFNEQVVKDRRVEVMLLHISDGIMLARKK